MTSLKIVAVIPCLNCSQTIARVIDETKNFLNEVIVVNDGSHDTSAYNAKQKGSIVISLKKNKGVGSATKAGMQEALKINADTIITLDADGAHNPADLENLINVHNKQKNTLTIGNRWREYKPELPSAKWWANQFASSLINSISKTNLPDVACGFRALNSQLARKLISPDTSQGFGFIYESIFLASKLGKIGYADVQVRYDANFLLATKKTELIHLLKISNLYCKNSKKKNIQKLINRVMRMEKIPVKITFLNKIDHFILYPIKEEQFFIFQKQHPDFVSSQSEFIEI